jgi:hypothetical protein
MTGSMDVTMNKTTANIGFPAILGAEHVLIVPFAHRQQFGLRIKPSN